MKVISEKRISRITRTLTFVGKKELAEKQAKKLRDFLRSTISWLKVFGPFSNDPENIPLVSLSVRYDPNGEEKVDKAIEEGSKKLGLKISEKGG